MLALPVMVVGVIPAALLFLFRNTGAAHAPAPVPSTQFFFGCASIAVGLALGVWTMGLFARFGRGTAAPWDPPERFVARGPYRHVRNPMISGVILILLGEALLLSSPPILTWCAVFAITNALYIPLVEEPGLVRRFGEEYETYRRNVPRWIPQIIPWRGGSDSPS